MNYVFRKRGEVLWCEGCRQMMLPAISGWKDFLWVRIFEEYSDLKAESELCDLCRYVCVCTPTEDCQWGKWRFVWWLNPRKTNRNTGRHGATGRNLQSKLIEKEERRKRRRRIWNTLTTALIHCINFSAGHRTTSGGWLTAKHYSVFIEKGNSAAQAPVLYSLAPEKKNQKHMRSCPHQIQLMGVALCIVTDQECLNTANRDDVCLFKTFNVICSLWKSKQWRWNYVSHYCGVVKRA